MAAGGDGCMAAGGGFINSSSSSGFIAFVMNNIVLDGLFYNCNDEASSDEE
jgi:hypothetical protein